LKFLRRTRRKACRNFKFTALARSERRMRHCRAWKPGNPSAAATYEQEWMRGSSPRVTGNAQQENSS
jgi:hypothetical protein